MDDSGVSVAHETKIFKYLLRLMMEVSLNAFQHSGATYVAVSTDRHSITIEHDGTVSSWKYLDRPVDDDHITGGIASFQDFQSAVGDEFMFIEGPATKRQTSLTVVDLIPGDHSTVNPCVVSPSTLLFNENIETQLNDCETIHVLLYINVMMSDLRRIALDHRRDLLLDRHVVFHGLDRDDPIVGRLNTWFPAAEIRYRAEPKNTDL